MSRRRHVMTARRRASLRKAQLASARKRRGRGRQRLSPRTKKALKYTAIGVGAVGAAAGGAYLADRQMNTVKIYHSTTHARARKIAKSGMNTKSTRHMISSKTGKRLRTDGDVYFAVGKNNTNKGSLKGGSYKFGNATLSARVRKKKLMKYSYQDLHYAAQPNYRRMPTSWQKDVGVKWKYTRSSKRHARKAIISYHNAPLLKQVKK